MTTPGERPEPRDPATHDPRHDDGGDEARTQPVDDSATSDDDAHQPTPFDHPLFLPVLFAAGCLWFGYDAYLNQSPDMLEHLEFNRFGLRVIVYATAMTGVQGLAEWRERTVSPWARVAIHAAMALWFAWDGWLNADPFYEAYRSFNQHAAVALGATALALAVGAWRSGDEPWRPGFGMALFTAAIAASFAWAGRNHGESPLLYGSTAAGLLALAFWLTRRAWQDRSEAAIADATG